MRKGDNEEVRGESKTESGERGRIVRSGEREEGGREKVERERDGREAWRGGMRELDSRRRDRQRGREKEKGQIKRDRERERIETEALVGERERERNRLEVRQHKQ